MSCFQPKTKEQLIMVIMMVALPMPLMTIINYLITVNIATFFIFYFDKRQALMKGWRVAELVLYILMAFGGSPGGWIGMKCVQHKTSKKKSGFRLKAVVSSLASPFCIPFVIFGSLQLEHFTDKFFGTL